MTRKIVLVLVLIGLAATQVGCHTVEGLGRDIAAAGEAISDAAGEAL